MLLQPNIYAIAMRKLRYCEIKALLPPFCSIFLIAEFLLFPV